MPQTPHNTSSVEKKSVPKLNWLSRHRGIPLTEKIFFIQNLHVMVRTGISLAAALRTLAEQTSHKRFRAVLTDIYGRVEKGTPFARALSAHPKNISHFLAGLV